MPLKLVGPESRGNLRLVEPVSATDQMVSIVEGVLVCHGMTTQQAADAFHLIRALDELGLGEKLLFAALDIIDHKQATRRS